MKIAVITTTYLKNFVLDSLKTIQPPCEIMVFTYQNFAQISQLYLELEPDFDGFIVSGNVPKNAIVKAVPHIKKPIVEFGTDLQSYYELFLQLIYGEGVDLSRGYFDLLDWFPDSKSMTEYLAEGEFGNFYRRLNQYVETMSLEEIAAKEQEVLQKHIRLWNEGSIDFSTTRFSSIAQSLQEARVRFYFIWPYPHVLEDALGQLMAEIRLKNMQSNQTCGIYVTIRRRALEPEETGHLDTLEGLLIKFNKENMGDFRLRPAKNGFEILTSYHMIEQITNYFKSCSLKRYVEQHAKFKVCIGYGVGETLKQSMANAKMANTESNINHQQESYLVNEMEEIIGPLDKNPLILSSKAPPYVQQISLKTGLSDITVQKILSVMRTRNTDELSSQDLAKALNITVRSANRYFKQLLHSGLAVIHYEKQSSSRGRPERVYKLLIDTGGSSEK